MRKMKHLGLLAAFGTLGMSTTAASADPTVWLNYEDEIVLGTETTERGWFFREDITGTEKGAAFLRDNEVGALFGWAAVGEVAPMLSPSRYAMTDDESAAVKSQSDAGFWNAEGSVMPGQWVPLGTAGVVQGAGDPFMTRGQAIAAGIARSDE